MKSNIYIYIYIDNIIEADDKCIRFITFKLGLKMKRHPNSNYEINAIIIKKYDSKCQAISH